MEFSGERFVPEMDIYSEISIFHRQRYSTILDVCKNKCVLDAACGEGYGSAILATVAQKVIGIDISNEAIENAREKYNETNLEFIVASVTEIPIENNSIDVVVSFETIEHISEDDQTIFFEEIKRILKKDGILIMSSPDKHNYSDVPHFHNEFHIHELYFKEFQKLVEKYFINAKYYYQGMFCNSYIYDAKRNIENTTKALRISEQSEDSRAEYVIAIAGDWGFPYDISSIVYDKANVYYKMKEEIVCLKERLGDPGKIIEQKENYIIEQRGWLNSLEDKLRETNGIVEQKENYIIEQRGRLNSLEDKLRETNGIVEQKENYIVEQREKIQLLETKFSEAESKLNRLRKLKVFGYFIRKIIGE